MLRGGHLVRAAAVLFGRAECLLPDFPQAVLRVARFRGTDRSELIDNRRLQGNAFDLLLKADRFLREFLPVAGRVVPDLFEREDDPLYPPLALRDLCLKAEQPEAYARFAAHEARQRAFLEKSTLTQRSVVAFEAEEQRLTRLQLFFAQDAEIEVLDFWGWDGRYKPEALRGIGARAPSRATVSQSSSIASDSSNG